MSPRPYAQFHPAWVDVDDKDESSFEPVKAIKRDKDGLIRCRVCGCTEGDACADGCSWVDDDLCSTCGSASEAIAAWIYGARRANKTALWREAVDKLERETR